MIAVDLEMPERGSPSIAYRADLFPHPPVFVVAIPPAGGEEDARLFAVCVDWSKSSLMAGGVFHEGARPPAAPSRAFALTPIDAEAVPRLFERGGHPGDLLVAGRRDPRGHPLKAVLLFMDLSQGLSHSMKVSTPIETRVALAVVFDGLGDAWARAADQLDPAALVRSGAVIPLGGNPLTAEGHHRLMLETVAAADARMGVDRHPMQDFRSLTREELADEIRRDGRAAAYGVPDLDPAGAGRRLLQHALGSLSDAVAGSEGGAAALDLVRCSLDQALRSSEDPVLRLASGSGPGAACWRNLFAPEGLVATAARRLDRPDCDDAVVDAVGRLPAWARRVFRDPAEILRRRPRRVDDLGMTLADRHRPWFALPARRISAAPALGDALHLLDPERLTIVVSGTRLLIEAFDTIPNAHPQAGQARDALALGWRVLVRAACSRGVLHASDLEAADPGVPETVATLPYAGMFSFPGQVGTSFRP